MWIYSIIVSFFLTYFGKFVNFFISFVVGMWAYFV